MFRIGEFSKLTQVSVRMLRYYDEAGLLKPAEVDRWTGHRLYSANQIPRLDRIRYLRDSGFQVSEIALALEMDDHALLAAPVSYTHLDVYKRQTMEAVEQYLNGTNPEKEILIAPYIIDASNAE